MKYFSINELSKSETARKHGINNEPDFEERKNLTFLVNNILDPVREKYGKPITVNSGYRCEELNKLVGGVPKSQHLKGEAADITCDNVPYLWKLVCEMIETETLVVGQAIYYPGRNFIHLSSGTRNDILYK